MKKLLVLIVILPLVTQRVFAEDYLNSVKITVLSWITGSTKVSYERAFPKYNQSGEMCVGLISAGYDKFKNKPVGYTIRYGYKFFMGGKHLPALQGAYLRPEVVFTSYDYSDIDTNIREHSSVGSILATAGYQYIYKRFLADAWVGMGYALGQSADTRYEHGFIVCRSGSSDGSHLALSFSIRLGICF